MGIGLARFPASFGVTKVAMRVVKLANDDWGRCPESAFNIGVWAVIALGNFLMPCSASVLPGDAGGLAGLLLFGCGDAGSGQRCIMGWKCLGEHGADLIGPAAIML